MKKLLFFMMATAFLAASSYGRTVSVSSMTRNLLGRPTATLQLATGDAAVLYVAYGTTDCGSDFDAWDFRRPIATVAGDATDYTYVFPQDVDGNCKVARFFLLEDYDLPLSKRYDYIQTDGSQYVETQFTPSGRSAVEMRLSLNSVASSVALCSARVKTSSADSFTAFYLAGSGWRFDYFGVGAAAAPVAVADQTYTLLMDGSGLYLDGTCISARTPVDKVSGRSLILFGAKYGNSPEDAEYKASVKLYSMKAWSNSTDVTSIVLDLVPTEHDGEPCLYNKIDGTYLQSAVSGHPLEHGAEVPVARPAVVSSSDSHVVGIIYYVDCVNGNDANPGTSVDLPKQTIRAATTNALSGDIIRVASGTYGDAEGTQTVGSTGASRVVIPVNVTLESTDGADVTFIVGAEATDDQIDNETYKTGANGVRCVYAKSGATIRGFTLMGGRGTGEAEADGKGRGSAFYSETARAAAVEGCIVTNNAAYIGTIYQAVVKRCRVVGNIGTRKSSAGVTCAGNGGPAGNLCSWYGSIIDGNIGGATVLSAYAFENCTIGIRNSIPPSDTPQVLWWYGTDDRAIVNSVILGGRYYFDGGGKLYCTNCLVMADRIGTVLKREQSYNTIFTNTSAAQVDSKTYGPILGKFAGIDSGDSTFSSVALGDKDLYDTPRVLNGTLDIGAVEYDWRPTFTAELGRRFTVTYASHSVTTNATGGLLVPDGAVAGTATSAGPHAITFTLTGGSLAVYVGGILVGESSGTGEQSIWFNVANVADEIRFVYTPEAGSTAVLSRFSGANGFIISYR